MNFKNALVFAIATAFAIPAFAEHAHAAVPQDGFKLTRAEVIAETLRARAAGELDATEATFPFTPASPASTLTRAEVIAETKRALAAGELDITEATYPFPLASQKSTLTRSAVRADVIRALAAGELNVTEASPNYPLN